MSEIKEFRCGRCQHPGFRESPSPGDGRPTFTCDRCGYTWTCGKGGGGYSEHATGEES